MDCLPAMVGSLSVSVRDGAGAPVAGATVTTVPATSTKTTDGSGLAHFEDIPINAYAVTAAKAGHHSASAVAGVALASTSALTLTLGPDLPPTVSALDQHQVGFGKPVTVAANASDPDDTALTYLWEQVGGQAVTLQGANTANVSFTTETLENALAAVGYVYPPSPGIIPIWGEIERRYTYLLKVTVSDPAGHSASQIVRVQAAAATTSGPKVPAGVRVYLWAGDATGPFSWSVFCNSPHGSLAVDGGGGRHASFVPPFEEDQRDVVTCTASEASTGLSVQVLPRWYTAEVPGFSRIVAWMDCAGCHDAMGTWTETRHAKTFSEILDGVLPAPGFDGTCLACHTTGAQRGQGWPNWGFADSAAEAGWSLPATFGAGAWASMKAAYPTVARRANVSCEGCHGPNDFADHQAARPRPRLGNCLACHEGNPDRVLVGWKQSPHLSGARHAAADLEPSSGDCSRCHSVQGFVAHRTQIGADENPADLLASDIAVGITMANVEPPMCAACHDPHLTSQAGDRQLRVRDTARLPSGVTASNVGAGAICMFCHSTRLGARGGSGLPADYYMPTRAASSDVFMAASAYSFSGLPVTGTANPMAIGDACVGCHMRPVASPGAGVDHSQRAPGQAVCDACHAHSLSGTQAAFDAKLSQLGTALTDAVRSIITAQAQGGNAWVHSVCADSGQTRYCGYGSGGNPDVAIGAPVDFALDHDLSGAQILGVRMRQAVPITFDVYDGDGNPAGTHTTDTFYFAFDQLKGSGGEALIQPWSTLLKAAWNYRLMVLDGSRGVHNPEFASSVLDASLAALQRDVLLCGGSGVDASSDPSHCGACGNVCTPPLCREGACVPAFSSCAQLRQVDPGAASGTYLMQVGGDLFQAYCDMTTGGGGWTRVFSLTLGNDPSCVMNGAAIGDPATGGHACAKYADEVINALAPNKIFFSKLEGEAPLYTRYSGSIRFDGPPGNVVQSTNVADVANATPGSAPGYGSWVLFHQENWYQGDRCLGAQPDAWRLSLEYLDGSNTRYACSGPCDADCAASRTSGLAEVYVR